jgi:hypothetical protein
MLNLLLRAFLIPLGLIGPAMAQERILIASDWGEAKAELLDNKQLDRFQMLPLTIEMRDQLRQEKTGNLPSPLPQPSDNLISQPGHWHFGSPIIRHLLPKWTRPSARNYLTWPSDW